MGTVCFCAGIGGSILVSFCFCFVPMRLGIGGSTEVWVCCGGIFFSTVSGYGGLPMSNICGWCIISKMWLMESC